MVYVLSGSALIAADVALIPIQPRSHDVWTLSKLTNMLDEIQASRLGPLIVHSFLNRADITSADNRDTAEALTSMPNLGFVSQAIKNRKAYPNSGAKGLAVFEVDQPDQKAVSEIEELFNQVTAYGRQPITTEA